MEQDLSAVGDRARHCKEEAFRRHPGHPRHCRIGRGSIDPMVDRAAPQTHYRLAVRLPGWLLIAMLAAPATFFGVRFAVDAFDRASPEPGIPVRLQVADATIENDVVSLRILIEANKPFDPLELRYHVTVERNGLIERLPTGASVLGPGAWEGRSAVIQVDRILPEGATFRELSVDGPGWSGGTGFANPAPELGSPDEVSP